MAQTMGDRLAEVIANAMQRYDATLDTSLGSRFDTAVLADIRARYSFEVNTDLESFVLARLATEVPQMSTGEADSFRAILARPAAMVMEPVVAEVAALAAARDTTNAATLRSSDIDALASNFMITRAPGTPATGTVRCFFRTPQNAFVPLSARFYRADGKAFLPLTVVSLTSDAVRQNRSGTEYYCDVQVIAEKPGSAYATPINGINRATGIAGVSRIGNVIAIDAGTDEASDAEMLRTVRSALTDESLTTARGIRRRLNTSFQGGIRAVEIVGAGDPEMERDVLEVSGDGTLVLSGIAFVAGSVMLLMGIYESLDADGHVSIRAGDTVQVNYPRAIYTDLSVAQRVERRTVAEVIFDGQEAMTDRLPPILLLQLDRGLTVTAPPAPALPGVHPFVSIALFRDTGSVTLGPLPHGIQVGADTDQVIPAGEIHVGGCVDVYARPSASESVTGRITLRSIDPIAERHDLCTSSGERSLRNCVHMAITAAVTGVSGTFVLGETVYFTASSVLATLTGYSAGVMSLSDLTGLPTPGGQVRGVSSTATANVASITSTTWASIGAEVGHALVPLDGFSPATILAIDGVFAWVSADAPVGTTGGRFRVIDASSADLFNPTELLVPFGSDVARDLATTIGSSTVRLLQNIQSLGVTTADTFEILEGLDIGTYAIRAWDPTLGGMAPVLDRAMRSTGSNLTYRVFRRGTGLPRPLTRILPGGVDLTAADGTLLGTKVPYALPVAAWAQTALQGAVEVGTGTVGFVLPDPGDAWAATSNVSPDLEDAHAPYSSGYVDSDGVIAVCTLLDDGTFYVNADLPTGVAEFITNLQSYFRDVGTAFGFGDDYTALVDGLLPFNLAAPPEGAPQLFQFEILLPPELFDGVNNCFVSLPEIRWDELFASSGTFSEAIQEFQNGAAVGTASPLASAQPGDALTILAGANAGSYRIRKVLTYYIATPGTIVDGEASLSRCYKVTMVIIDGAFPAAPLEGLAAFLTTGMEALVDTGVAPTFPGTATDADGNAASPWAWVQLAMTYFFNRMTLYGFSYPSAFTLDPGVTLATLWRALFVGYTVARPSGTGVLRFAWVEPTGVRLRASMVSETITYQLPVAEAPTVTGARITLPLHDLEDLILTITLDGITLAATLDSAAAALSTLEELAAWLQDVLDPAGAYLTVEGPATQSGALTFTGRPFANPSTLTVDTTSTPNAALLLGFWDATGSPAELTASGMPAAVEDVFDRVELTTSMTGFIALQTTVSTVDTDHQIEWTTEISEDRLYGFHEIAAMLETKMAAVLTAAYPSEDLEVTVVYALFNRFEITITGTNLTAWSLIQPANPVDFSPQIFGASIGATIHTSGYPATGSPLKVIGGLPYFYARAPRLGYLSGYTLAGDGAADADDWEISARLVDYQTAFEDVVPVIEACILASDTTALAAYMNATEAFYASDGSRRVVYVGGDTGILVRSIQIGRAFTLTSTDNPSLTTSAASGANAYAIGIMSATGDIDDGNSTDTGGQTAGEEQTRVVNARDATRARHVTASGAVIDYEVQVEEGDEGSTILPLPVGSNEITVGQYPRDGSCETIPDDSSTMRVRFTGEGTAPVSAMVRAGDILDIYPQRVLLTQEDPIAASLKGVDRPIGLVTRAGSNVLTLPQHLAGEFNLLSPQSRPEDAVAAGDILWVEEGPDVGAFTVVQVVDTHTLIVDRPLTTSTQPILRTGCTAELTMGRSDVRIYELTPKASDVGYWLVLWGARTDTTIGCFRITALTPPTSTDPRFWTLALDMDADFETTEDNLMWAIIQPPAVAPGDSGVSGRTELLGVVPVRIYRGTATALTIAHVHPALKREESWVACADAANALTDGHKNPHRIRRLGEYVVPANVMAQQIDGGLYYVDVPVRTVSAAIRDALPTLTRLEPVVGTFDADGYWLETEDTRTSWSVLEQTRIYMSREVQRDTQAGDGTDRATLEGASLQVQAEWGSVLARVQANLNGAEDRQLCASYLVRGYLLAYVYLNANVSGGESASAAAKAIQEWINGLNADDDLRVSSIHGILHRHGYSTYRSPIELLSVTHDLDRRLVGWRSFDRLTDAEVPYHGSSRITAYVAGPDRSAVADAVDVPPGERIRLSGGEQDA